ncbi:Alanyl-tRNA synthetase family protein [Planococcus halocryophilus Or1]|uniref:Alanyl-tRNA editing protein n=1 Tax=Planococcus halocryophilus TaxID=1215089 RepID=A0A1C7DRW1_9BACL|nr:DHHA1 domain-containing protein [Planococcus halocryophilus]ANU14127.1 alanyl-tRNA editing protein [Planococcus halocryophilus]EMF47277.1 Alanyl-tRNA synthetase family protein [Planococcus halocryophilus Or1]
MTTKLYYEDSTVFSTEVHVIDSGEDETGYYVVLDQSCFYPEGGGQPADTGEIGLATVWDVQLINGEIRHYTDIELPKERFSAQLDEQRRRDHMQQHAGQHLLSALFEDTLGLKTQSFHLGKERVTIDLDLDIATKEQLQEIEKKANELIGQALPISTRWVTSEKAQTLKLRKPPVVDGAIRLVEIEGIDLNACGGTHPKNTAEIGLLKLISTEKSKGGMRVYFLCGNRALDYFNFLLNTADQLVVQLNAPVAELSQAAETLLVDKASMSKTIKSLQEQLLNLEAKTIVPENQLIQEVFENRSIKELQQLARLVISQHPSAIALFISSTEDDMRFVCAKGQDAQGDMREVLKQLLTLTDGKGGGNVQFAQGGGKTTEPPTAFLSVFQKTLKKFM